MATAANTVDKHMFKATSTRLAAESRSNSATEKNNSGRISRNVLAEMWSLAGIRKSSSPSSTRAMAIMPGKFKGGATPRNALGFTK
eukprot:CAMPEP_0204079810 /NCGR_PEP_ID=MMETSP0360-20130528/172949_1 /ASSEMBLY_ACC=CAM_ASM_000342 /TAXON_ID=268821 /ORGANISM="Scrippsiella Hangoei, Strain SHTV-5" /LENGTH=85 /DNA_ID=CAMNT_0051028559 /DNA_START=82 /DNA_END=336 /DNA_ORIENTATION=+